MRQAIILLGPPGSGKGTQAVRLANALSYPHVSTGDLFRSHIKMQTALGKKAKEFIDRGQLVPDELVFEILFERICQPDANQGFILDGFPRRISQAEELKKRLGPEVNLVVLNLQVSDKEVIERLSGRLTCASCHTIHHLKYSPPRVSGKCNACGGDLIQRPDDAAHVVTERLQVYRKETAPLIDYYAKANLLVSVDGEKKPDDVFKSLLTVVDNLKK